MKIENYDQTIKEDSRRKHGAYFTPKIFVDYAHKMISEQFGEDWREKYIVWDCAWGTGNLTRDYNFKELYCSTLEQAELDIARDINNDATKFKYDFLNDNFGDLPEGLKQAFIEKKSILFLINPPYGGTGNGGANQGSKEKGLLKTKINNKMLKEGIGGAASQEFYTQFLYRIADLKREFNADVNIALFCNPKFMAGSNFKKFRNMFMGQFNFINGIYFNAGHFSDVSAVWGITFNIWKSGNDANRKEFLHTLVDVKNGKIIKIGEKILYNLDNEKTCSDWIKEPIKGIKTTRDALQMTSALAWRDTGELRGSIAENSIGYYFNDGNRIQYNTRGCFIVSSCTAHGHGNSILPENFSRVCSNFAARRLITQNWINDNDGYMVPAGALGYYENSGNQIQHNTQGCFIVSSCTAHGHGNSILPNNFHRVCSNFAARRLIDRKWFNGEDSYMVPNEEIIKYLKFENDSIVFSLFENKSLQSSLRNVKSRGKIWNIKNEFFFMGKEEMMNLAEEAGFKELYNDAENSQNRFVYNILKHIEISSEAQAVLDKACDIVCKSFKYRKNIHENHPEYYLQAWDAGWYQIRKLSGEIPELKEDLLEFRSKFKILKEKMRPMVYELEFLKK